MLVEESTELIDTGFPTQCGRDSNGSTAGGGVQAPEAYASRSLKPGVTASSPYTSCKSDGTAGINITLTASCIFSSGAMTGSASVTWNGNTVTCSFATESTVSQTELGHAGHRLERWHLLRSRQLQRDVDHGQDDHRQLRQGRLSDLLMI